jgi:hypothetical protein
MAGGGGSTGGIGAQSPASGGFGGNMGGGFGGNMGGGFGGNMGNASAGGFGGGYGGGMGGQPQNPTGGFGGSEYSPNPMGGFGGDMGGSFGGRMLSNMGNNTRLGNNMGQQQTMPYQPAIGMPGGQGGQTTYQNPNPQVGGPAQLVGEDDAFFQSPEFKAYQNDPSNMMATQDMYYSPIFGQMTSGSAGRAQEKAYRKYKGLADPNQHYGQLPQNPMPQPGFGGIEQDQDFRNFRSQHDDLSRQMNEYMQKAPMYQQLQELQGKMQGVQSRYAPQQQQQMQRPQQRGRYPNFNPMQQQLGGLAALLGGLGGMGGMGGMGGRGGMPQQGAYEQYVDRNNRALASPTQEVKQPTMSRADFDARERQMMNPARQQFNPAYFG